MCLALQVRENQLRLRVLCLENANRVLREQMDRKEADLAQLRCTKNYFYIKGGNNYWWHIFILKSFAESGFASTSLEAGQGVTTS